MKQLLALILFLASGGAFGQNVGVLQHVYPAEDTNNVFTGQDSFQHLNGNYIVAPNAYATVQAALTDACLVPAATRTIVSLSSLSSENITSLAGCHGAVVEDDRQPVSQVYVWNDSTSAFVLQGYVPGLQTVALTGDYNDLKNRPSLAPVATSGAYKDLTGAPALSPVATSGAYSDLTGVPFISKVGHTGLYTDLIGVPTINLNSLNTGGDMGLTIATADAQYAGQKIVFETTQPSTISTSFTLSSGHRLEYHADVTQTASATLQSNTGVQCFGSTIDATGFAQGTGNVYQMAPDTHNVAFQNCTFVSNYDVALQDPGASVDVSMTGNFFHNSTGFVQQGASAGDPTLRFNFLNNSVVMDSPANIPGVVMYGATQHSLFAQNHFLNSLHGVELYAGDAGVVFPHPTVATIQSLGLRNDMFVNNTCENMTQTCLWASMADSLTYEANTAHGCGDPCYDLEGTSNSLVTGNIAGGVEGDGAGYYTVFYSSHNVVFSNNTANSSGPYGFAIWENDQSNSSYVNGLEITGNTFTCYVTGGCNWFRADSNSDTSVSGNHVWNGKFDSPGYSDNMAIKDNFFTVTLPAAIDGIDVPIFHNGSPSFVEGNAIINEGGTGSCLSAGLADFNTVDTVFFTGNRCYGFPTDGHLINSGGNVPARFVFRNNFFSTGTINTDPKSNAGVQIIRTGNCLTLETNNPCQN